MEWSHLYQLFNNSYSNLFFGKDHHQFTQHDDVIKSKHFPRYWQFVRGIHRSPVNSPHKGQWHGALVFSLICVWINGWVNNREAGDLRRYCAHCDVSAMATRIYLSRPQHFPIHYPLSMAGWTQIYHQLSTNIWYKSKVHWATWSRTCVLNASLNILRITYMQIYTYTAKDISIQMLHKQILNLQWHLCSPLNVWCVYVIYIIRIDNASVIYIYHLSYTLYSHPSQIYIKVSCYYLYGFYLRHTLLR